MPITNKIALHRLSASLAHLMQVYLLRFQQEFLLCGALHGGANQAVLEMLEAIDKDGGDTKKYMAKAKDKNDPFRLMGFGHRVYKNFDPRARIIKKSADEVLNELGIKINFRYRQRFGTRSFGRSIFC